MCQQCARGNLTYLTEFCSSELFCSAHCKLFTDLYIVDSYCEDEDLNYLLVRSASAKHHVALDGILQAHSESSSPSLPSRIICSANFKTCITIEQIQRHCSLDFAVIRGASMDHRNVTVAMKSKRVAGQPHLLVAMIHEQASESNPVPSPCNVEKTGSCSTASDVHRADGICLQVVEMPVLIAFWLHQQRSDGFAASL